MAGQRTDPFQGRGCPVPEDLRPRPCATRQGSTAARHGPPVWGVKMGRDGLGDDIPDDEVNFIGTGPALWMALCSRRGSFRTRTVFCLRGHRTLRFRGNSMASAADVKGRLSIPLPGGKSGTGAGGRTWLVEPFGEVRLPNCPARYEHHAAARGRISFRMRRKGSVICRPVDIIAAPDGSLLVSDDYAGAVYRIAKAL